MNEYMNENSVLIPNHNVDYYIKYIKYKAKYLNLLNQNQNTNQNTNQNEDDYDKDYDKDYDDEMENNMVGGSTLYVCKPNKPKYIQICTKDNKGTFKTKELCQDECDPRFIAVQLKRANLYKETLQFYFFTKDLINREHMSIYIKGGNVIGLAVLKMIYDTYSHDDRLFAKAFNNFLKLELIKDWDFTGFTDNKEITPQYRAKLDKLAQKQKLVPRAKTFILYQARIPILIYEKALFEIAILDSDSSDFSKMEIPMTTMKVKVDSSNIKYIFMLAKSFYSWTEKHIPIDLDIIKKILSTMKIIIHPHKAGLYEPGNKLDAGELNKDLVQFIHDFVNGDIYQTQFLITMMEDPYRLVYRMGEKNIKKTEKILDFINKNFPKSKSHPSWLVDTDKISKLMDKFCIGLGKHLIQIYKQTGGINGVFDFLSGANFGKPQIQIEWDEFPLETKEKLFNIFGPLVKQIGLDKFKTIIGTYNINPKAKSSDLTFAEKVVKLFKFLDEKKFFK